MRFDAIVIGAGHAGVEAAFAAARLGCSAGLCTLSRETVAHMPCNPAVGGTAKGHLVREIDALGGLMGRAIDATGIQFKLLNRSRGPAVWSPRAQADKRRYALWVTEALEREPNITWVFGRAGRIEIEHERVVALAMEDGDRHECRALVITTGMFLNGLIHIGREQRPAGRHGEPPSRDLATSIRSFGFEVGRLKTGTPPRLHRDSIDFHRAVSEGLFVEEPGDAQPVPFSFSTRAALRNQVCCWLLHTNDAVRDLVRSHIGSSPLYNGQIQGIGPRYCSSLEPYRMFTSRAEHRLLLRIDNADLRLTPAGRRLGLIDEECWARFEARRDRHARNIDTLNRTFVRTSQGERVAASALLLRPGERLESLMERGEVALEMDGCTRELDLASVANEVKYEGYLKQEAARAERMRRQERKRIPEGFAFAHVPGLSREVVHRLSQIRPETLGQASRIPGVTPAAVAVLGVYLDRPQL